MTDHGSPAWICGRADRRRASNFGASLRPAREAGRTAAARLGLNMDGKNQLGRENARWIALSLRADAGMSRDHLAADCATATADSHFISCTLSFGWDTSKCHSRAWKDSVCGVTVSGLTTGMRTQASAT